MKAVTYIEIDVDRCALLYGDTNDAGTCPAVLGTDSAIKCHNSLGTCPSTVRAHFVNEPVTLRFAINVPWLPDDIRIEAASVESISYSPGTISLGKDLGTRSSLSVTFLDHPHSDTGMAADKYLSERDYDPYSLGSYWGKFRARNPFLRTRAIRLIQGIVGQSLAEMDTRHFIIDSFNGPTQAGKFTITAKDTLKLADGDRAQYPPASTGYLAADLAAEEAEFTLLPAGIGDDEYPEEGYISIGGKEIVLFERTGDVITITGRGELDTEASDHKSGDRAQVVKDFVAEDPADVLSTLLQAAGVSSDVIPIDQWKTETSTFYRRVVTTYITEPTSVRTLVNELIQQCGLAVWWDDVQQIVRLMVLRQINTDTEIFNDDNIVEGSLEVREQPDKCITGSWIFFGLRTPLESLSEPSSYRSSALKVELDVEENWGSPAINKIFSRWIPFGGRSAADRLNEILLGRFQRPPRHFTFKLFRRGDATPELGEGVRIFGLPALDATGAQESVPAQIVRLTPGDGEWIVEAEEQLFIDLNEDDPDSRSIIIDASAFNINLKSLHDILFPAAFHGLKVNVTVLQGAVIGGNSLGVFSLVIGDWLTQSVTGNRTSGSPIITDLTVDTADWAAVGQRVFGTGIPAGAKILTVDSASQITLDMNATSGTSTATALVVHTVIINVALRGSIVGRGGRGGDAGHNALFGESTTHPSGYDGEAGSGGLYTRYSINLDLSTGLGEVFGGGGGGGGSTAWAGSVPGRPGGGGAGALLGQPGSERGFVEKLEPYIVPATAGTKTNGGTGGYDSSGGNPNAGGNGGNAGQAGTNGSDVNSGGGVVAGLGGAAAPAIDGVSYVIKIGAGDIRGSEIN